MQPVATPLERVRKRGPSRQTSCSDLNDAASTRSQRSAGSLKFYRYNVLARARVYIHSEYPPAEIQALLDVIFTREITKTRRREISRIAKETAKEFSNKTRGAHRENDLIEALYDAFCEMFPDKKFNCPRKAGMVLLSGSGVYGLRANLNLDWDPNLKPGIQQEHVWDPDALGQANNETDDAIDRPSKRQQVNGSFPSPDTLQSTSQPPAAPSQPKQDGAVRNPRPDFTFGHHHPTITGALMKRGLSRFKADDFPRFLQQQQRLFSDPTMDYLDVRFPIQTFEGKAYATGRPVFEAENQAAVSGACMVNLQQQLTDLYESVFPDSKESQTPFAFSVCTEGPVIQFWVHYFLIEEGIRMHYMNLLSICNGSLYDTLEVLLVKWEQLMGWYGDDFLKEIADRLYDLANHTAHS